MFREEDHRGEVEEGLFGLQVLHVLPFIDGGVKVVDVLCVPLELEDDLSVLRVLVVVKALHSVVHISDAVHFERAYPLNRLLEFVNVDLKRGKFELCKLDHLHLLIDLSEFDWVLLPEKEVYLLFFIFKSLISQQEITILFLNFVKTHDQLIKLEHALLYLADCLVNMTIILLLKLSHSLI